MLDDHADIGGGATAVVWSCGWIHAGTTMRQISLLLLVLSLDDHIARSGRATNFGDSRCAMRIWYGRLEIVLLVRDDAWAEERKSTAMGLYKALKATNPRHLYLIE